MITSHQVKEILAIAARQGAEYALTDRARPESLIIQAQTLRIAFEHGLFTSGERLELRSDTEGLPGTLLTSISRVWLDAYNEASNNREFICKSPARQFDADELIVAGDDLCSTFLRVTSRCAPAEPQDIKDAISALLAFGVSEFGSTSASAVLDQLVAEFPQAPVAQAVDIPIAAAA